MLILMLRTLLVYLLILLAMRLMGIRQLGELQPAELVSTILISNLASISIESPELPLTASLVPVFLIAALELLLSGLCFCWPGAARLLFGSPVTVIRNGKICRDTLRTLRFGTGDLLEALRGNEVFDPAQVRWAVVETNGSISICTMDEEEPFIPVIADGQLLKDALRLCGKDCQWLSQVLRKESCSQAQVMLLLARADGKYQLIKKENSPSPQKRNKGLWEGHL